MTVARIASILVLVCVCFVADSYGRSYGSFHRNSNRRPSWGNAGDTRQPYEAESTVILTHVIFRHGNRTGQLSEIYPRDPYYNYTYFPFGRGQLTNAGKLREYNIGRQLRSRYNKFLGDYFYPEIVDAVSTDYNRTKASLLLVLASLFPPRRESVWNNDFNWQPVPYNYLPTNRDPVLIGLNCPAYTRRLEEVKRTPKWQAEFNNNKRVFNYISKNTGLNVQTYKEVYDLYFGLSTESEWGHVLPQWTTSVWPNIITDLAIKNYYLETATTELIKYAEGFHLKKIIDDTKTKVRNINVEPGRRMYLYSAHENNIAEMLITLNVFSPPHVPTYGSYLILEVHNINNVIGIKIYYQRYVSEYPVLLKIPACGEFCPLDRFEQLFEEFLPASEDLCYRT